MLEQEKMEKSILLHCLSPEEFKSIVKEIIRAEFVAIKKELAIKEYDVLLTRVEASELLKINISTLWHWTKKGRVKAYGTGNRVFYKQDELYI